MLDLRIILYIGRWPGWLSDTLSRLSAQLDGLDARVSLTCVDSPHIDLSTVDFPSNLNPVEIVNTQPAGYPALGFDHATTTIPKTTDYLLFMDTSLFIPKTFLHDILALHATIMFRPYWTVVDEHNCTFGFFGPGQPNWLAMPRRLYGSGPLGALSWKTSKIEKAETLALASKIAATGSLASMVTWPGLSTRRPISITDELIDTLEPHGYSNDLRTFYPIMPYQDPAEITARLSVAVQHVREAVDGLPLDQAQGMALDLLNKVTEKMYLDGQLSLRPVFQVEAVAGQDGDLTGLRVKTIDMLLPFEPYFKESPWDVTPAADIAQEPKAPASR